MMPSKLPYLFSSKDKIHHQVIDRRYIFTVAERYYSGTVEYILTIRIPYRFLGFRLYRYYRIASYYPKKIETVESAVEFLKEKAEKTRISLRQTRRKKEALINIKHNGTK